MTTSIPTASSNLKHASGAGAAASFFGGDTCTGGAPADFATLLGGDTPGSASATGASAPTTASVLAGAAVAPTLAVSETDAAPSGQAPSREMIEQAAALLASLWATLQPETPVQATPPADGGAGASGAVPAGLTVTLQWGAQKPFVVTLPAGTQPPADLAEQLGKQILASLDQAGATPAATEATTDATTEGSVTAEALPELSISLDVAAPAIHPENAVGKPAGKGPVGGAEKFAGKIRLPEATDGSSKDAAEKNFLAASDEDVTESGETDGIAVAKPAPTMPAFFATRQITPERFESAAHSWISDNTPTQHAAESVSTPEATSPASLARRAVDTIQSVIETQHIRTDHMGVVSLNFKFGADDLAVRVQLRNGEVHTQFRTDSAELRSALSDEWHALAVGQGADSGPRLIEPVFAPSNSSLAQQHTGSGSFGQQFAQKQQQEAQAPFALPEVRTFRKGLSAATAAAAEIAPQIVRNLPTSLHLTAFA